MRVFVIPDIHLKIYMLKKADQLIQEGEYDRIVFLGDIVDDWDKQGEVKLYQETFEAIYEFIKKYRDKVFFCKGNHDISYVLGKEESGFSKYARGICIEGAQEIERLLPEGHYKFVFRVENVLFSHAGLTYEFLQKNDLFDEENIDKIIEHIETLPSGRLWDQASPIWVRLQNGYKHMTPYPEGMLQVVGHTPVKYPYIYNGVLSVDTFSTFRDGRPIGDTRFVCVNTKDCTWEYVS